MTKADKNAPKKTASSAIWGGRFAGGPSQLMTNINAIGPALSSIFTEAFNLNTAFTGGFWGLVFLGIRRAVFSNESGVGNAPMYHGQSETKEPLHEGLVAGLGPLLDTVLVCSITGIIIIISGGTTTNRAQCVNGAYLQLCQSQKKKVFMPLDKPPT